VITRSIDLIWFPIETQVRSNRQAFPFFQGGSGDHGNESGRRVSGVEPTCLVSQTP
jgi:hypothetical protein